MDDWGYDLSYLKTMWELVDNRKTYHENKRRLEGAMYAQCPYEIEWIQVDTLEPLFERDVGDLTGLKRSIKKQCLVQPLVVRKSETIRDKKRPYEIIVGFRRWEAAQKVGLLKVPCIVRKVSKEQARILNTIENLHRKNKNPIEAAEFYKEWLDESSVPQRFLALSTGKSQAYISNRIRLLRLTDKNRSYVAHGKLTPEHGMRLLEVSDPNLQTELGEKAVAKRLTTRQLRNVIKKSVEEEKINVDQFIKEILLRPPCELIHKISDKIQKKNDRCFDCSLYKRCKNLARAERKKTKNISLPLKPECNEKKS